MIYFTLVVIVINPVQGSAPVVQQPVVQQSMARDPNLIYMSCDQCAWTNGYETMPSAKMGLGAHRGWCKRGHGRKLRPFG